MLLSTSFVIVIVALSFLPAAVRAESAATETRDLIELFNPHSKTTWSVAESRLQDTGGWDGHGEPPLSLSRAAAIARSYLESRGLPVDRGIAKIELRRPAQLEIPYYFYFVSFDHPRSEKLETYEEHVVVLLDGTVVPPVRTSR